MQKGIYGIHGKHIQNAKRNKVLHHIAQNKRAQGRKTYYQAKSGPSIWRKRTQAPTKRSPNSMKPYRHGPHIPRGPPAKPRARTASLGGDQPMGAPDPLMALFGPNFGQLALTASPTSMASVFQKNCTEEWRFAQDRKACKEAQLNSIFTIHLMTI